ncbi:MAG: 3-isopropylmalate dehydrogenase [Chloroflexi bacterium RBG_16_48_8]|nr:MAG: 3-isopropylmalate dehydrogenase [Chloroflexi bacterium RBG_16_48_8]
MDAKIVLLPGDGIGLEVVSQGHRVLEAVAERKGHSFEFEEHLIGGCAMDQVGDPFPPDSLEACQNSDAVLLGAVGGPQWDDPQAPVRPEQGLLRLRQELCLYANLRPVHAFPGLSGSSPLKPEKVEDVDMLIVRELTGGLYFGKPRYREQHQGQLRAVDTMVYTESEIRRVVRLAFQLARGRRRKVTSVDKANILECSRLWRLVANEVARDFPDVEFEHQLVDSAAMRLIVSASSIDVLVTSNMFGDILSDEASVLSGSLGMIPSASLGEGKLGVYEPIHGSAPDIAGKGIANPLGAILSVAMLLRHSLGLEDGAKAVEEAVAAVLSSGGRTKDLGGDLSTSEMGDAVIGQLDTLL